MGSVQAFPRRGSVGTIADVWRLAPTPGTGVLRVREMRLEDCAAIRALQRRVRANVAPWSLQQLESQRHIFPEGQLVAEVDGEIVGAASSFIVHWNDRDLEQRWDALTGEGYFTTHDPHGRTLFAPDLVVDVTHRGFGAGRALYQARRRLCRSLNLRRILMTARLAGYGAMQDAMPPERYAMKVLWGDIADADIGFALAQGFQYCGVLRDFHAAGADACGHAALLAWINPLHAPPRPPAAIERERQRKCA